MKYAIITASILSMSAGAAIAQSEAPQKQKEAAQQPLHFMLSEDVLGAALTSVSGDSAGTINDVIVDAKTTKLSFAIISVGGIGGLGDKLAAIPIDKVRWDPMTESFVLGATRSLIDASPSFDAERWSNLEREEWQKALAPADDEGDQKTLIRLSDISGTKIEATSTSRDVVLEGGTNKIGEIDGAILEWTTRSAPFVLISTGGVLGFGADDRVAPWKAMVMHDQTLLLTGISAEAFKDLEEVKRSEIETFDSAKDVSGWFEAFGVEPDAFKPEKKRPSTGG